MNNNNVSKPLFPDKRYHFHVIYNHAQSPHSANEDNNQSLEYTETVVSRLSRLGFDKSYYHKRDARPGHSMFDELFRVIRESGFTFLILTRGFLDNCWSMYSGMSAFKKRLDKRKGHRVIALAFNLTDKEIPDELCHHHVLHFTGDSEVDDGEWQKLKQVMCDGDNLEPITHPAVSERGDNRLHTDDNQLVAHPSGEQSLTSLNSLNMDGETQQTRRDNVSSDTTGGLVQRVDSLYTDGAGDHRSNPSISQADGNMFSVHSLATQGTSNSSKVHENSAAGNGELKTVVLKGQEPVTADLRPSQSARPNTTSVMTLEASPTVCAPVAKILPSESTSKKTLADDSRAAERKVNSNIERELQAEGKVSQVLSLSNDDDITFDNGSQEFVGAAYNTEKDKSNTGDKHLNQNKQPHSTESSLCSQTATITSTLKSPNEDNVTLNPNNESSEVNFQDLILDSIQADELPKQPADLGYTSEKVSPEARPEGDMVNDLNVLSSDEISSRWFSRDASEATESGLGISPSSNRSSMDMQNLKENPEDVNAMNIIDDKTELDQFSCNTIDNLQDEKPGLVTDDSMTEVKRVCDLETPIEFSESRNPESSSTEVKIIRSDNMNEQPGQINDNEDAMAEAVIKPDRAISSRNRPAPEGEDAVVTMGNGVSRTVQQSENSASTKESEEIPLISENQQVSARLDEVQEELLHYPGISIHIYVKEIDRPKQTVQTQTMTLQYLPNSKQAMLSADSCCFKHDH